MNNVRKNKGLLIFHAAALWLLQPTLTIASFQVTDWMLPEYFGKVSAGEIEDLIRSEESEPTQRTLSSARNLGRTQPKLMHVSYECLRDIHARSQEFPVALDIGAGFGAMTWKMLLAGAKVEAIEMEPAVTTELKNRIFRTIGLKLWPIGELKEKLTVSTGNALAILGEEKYRNKFDVIWLGHVIHFFRPEELERLPGLLSQVLKPGGKIFLTVGSIYQYQDETKPEVLALLKAAHEKAKAFNPKYPGLMAINFLVQQGAGGKTTHDIESIIAGAELYAHPFELKAFGAGSFPDLRRKPKVAGKAAFMHGIMNYLDLDSAAAIFTESELMVEKCYYSNLQGDEPVNLGTEIGPVIEMVLGKAR